MHSGGNKNISESSKEIFLIRHGETAWNKQGLSQGSLNDIELNDKGKDQSKITGAFLKNRLKDGKSFDLIMSSPMIRSVQTASIIADILQYNDDILVKDYLTETDLGKLAVGLTDE